MGDGRVVSTRHAAEATARQCLGLRLQCIDLYKRIYVYYESIKTITVEVNAEME